MADQIGMAGVRQADRQAGRNGGIKGTKPGRKKQKMGKVEQEDGLMSRYCADCCAAL